MPSPKITQIGKEGKMSEICAAEKIGLQVGNTIFLLAGVKEIVCKDCVRDSCPYQLANYTRQSYKDALKHFSNPIL